MSESTTSHTQHTMDAWKKIVDRQLELVSSLSEEALRLRKIGADKVAENVEMVHRVSKESAEHVREMADVQEPVAAWKELMDRQLEVVAGLSKSMTDLQGESVEKSRSTLDTLSNLSKKTMDHTLELNRAWHEAAMDTAKRATGWMPSSF